MRRGDSFPVIVFRPAQRDYASRGMACAKTIPSLHQSSGEVSRHERSHGEGKRYCLLPSRDILAKENRTCQEPLNRRGEQWYGFVHAEMGAGQGTCHYGAPPGNRLCRMDILTVTNPVTAFVGGVIHHRHHPAPVCQVIKTDIPRVLSRSRGTPHSCHEPGAEDTGNDKEEAQISVSRDFEEDHPRSTARSPLSRPDRRWCRAGGHGGEGGKKLPPSARP